VGIVAVLVYRGINGAGGQAERAAATRKSEIRWPGADSKQGVSKAPESRAASATRPAVPSGPKPLPTETDSGPPQDPKPSPKTVLADPSEYSLPPTVDALKREELETIERLVNDSSSDAVALGLLAQVYCGQERCGEAVKCWRRCLELDPKNARAYDVIAAIALHQEDHEEAISLWRKAAKIDPNTPRVHYHLAQALMLSGRPEEQGQRA